MAGALVGPPAGAALAIAPLTVPVPLPVPVPPHLLLPPTFLPPGMLSNVQPLPPSYLPSALVSTRCGYRKSSRRYLASCCMLITPSPHGRQHAPPCPIKPMPPPP